jgi:hypothetical protein
MTRAATVVWHDVILLTDGVSISTAIAELLDRRPNNVRGKVRASVTIGFSRAPVKRLDGLPSLRSSAQMTQMLREHASAVFMSRADAAAIPDVWRSADGSWWGSAIDRAAIDETVAGANRVGIRVLSMIPTVCALARIRANGTAVIDDGRAVVEATTHDGELREVRRTLARFDVNDAPAALRSFGDDAHHYAGAYAAAMATRRVPLAWRVEPDPAFSAIRRRTRVAAMTVVLVAATAAAILAPGLRAVLIVRHARSAAGTSNVRDEIARVESDLRTTTRLLATAARFDSSRGAVMRLVAQLGQSLPESTAIVSLRVDSLESSFTAIAPHVTDVLGELGSVDRIENPRIVGAVTHEIVAGAHVERATFRFRRATRALPTRSGDSTRVGKDQ